MRKGIKEMNKNDADVDSKSEIDPEIDELIMAVGLIIEAQNSRPAIVNRAAVQKVKFTYELAKWLVRDLKGVKVTYKLHRPYKSSGAVTIEGPCLEFMQPDLFMKLVKFVGNFDMYVKTTGVVCLDFSFDNLTTMIRG